MSLAPTLPIPPIVLNDGALLCDNSTFEYGSTCPTSFLFYKFFKKEQARERAALKFGGIIHKALEARYNLLKNDAQKYANFSEEVLHAALHQIRLGFAEWQPEVGEWRTYDVAVGAIMKYAAAYPIEFIKVIAVERAFSKFLGYVNVKDLLVVDESEVEKVDEQGNPIKFRVRGEPRLFIGKLPIVWTGKIDLIYEVDGRLYYRDHKTTSMLGPSYFYDYDLSSQVHGYGWAIGQELGRIPYSAEINALGIRKPTKTGMPYEFQRKLVQITPELVAEWQLDTLTTLQTLLSYASQGFFPKATKQCSAKYGECQYKSICTLTKTNERMMMLSTGEYKDVTWSPLDES